PDREMLKRLRVWGADTARAIGKPAFTVLPDSSLEALAQSRPANVTALANIPGIGPVKIERYGDDILDLVAEAA
ncbi:MAG: HRDC domain-containing protein, partial [Promicromonosporaceae bacterium]|nr:HRDC domain-containing protein [Promicromonosporaceae bacterium]